MATTEEWRRNYTKYKDDVKRRGKPFYPYAMFHDTVMSLVVVSVIIALAAVWFYTSTEDPKDCSKAWDSCTRVPTGTSTSSSTYCGSSSGPTR
jgi:hypothetical protein